MKGFAHRSLSRRPSNPCVLVWSSLVANKLIAAWVFLLANHKDKFSNVFIGCVTPGCCPPYAGGRLCHVQVTLRRHGTTSSSTHSNQHTSIGSLPYDIYASEPITHHNRCSRRSGTGLNSIHLWIAASLLVDILHVCFKTWKCTVTQNVRWRLYSCEYKGSIRARNGRRTGCGHTAVDPFLSQIRLCIRPSLRHLRPTEIRKRKHADWLRHHRCRQTGQTRHPGPQRNMLWHPSPTSNPPQAPSLDDCSA